MTLFEDAVAEWREFCGKGHPIRDENGNTLLLFALEALGQDPRLSNASMNEQALEIFDKRYILLENALISSMGHIREFYEDTAVEPQHYSSIMALQQQLPPLMTANIDRDIYPAKLKVPAIATWNWSPGDGVEELELALLQNGILPTRFYGKDGVSGDDDYVSRDDLKSHLGPAALQNLLMQDIDGIVYITLCIIDCLSCDQFKPRLTRMQQTSSFCR